MTLLIKRLLLLASLTLAAGCTVVKPWERNLLAKEAMSFDPHPMATDMQQHIYFSKEGSSSGSAVTGGGCGCN